VFALAVALCWPTGVLAATPIKPVLGNWEGRGPYGLRLSYELVRGTHGVVVRNFALGLPNTCRSTGLAGWDAGVETGVSYLPPGARLHGPFAPLGPKEFIFSIAPAGKLAGPVELDGTLSSNRRGTLSILSPRLTCARGGWPNTLRFTIAATRRVKVADGLWTGSVGAPPTGINGSVTIRVIAGGRIETDFSTSYTCPLPAGETETPAGFEIGPLPTVGAFIGADGRVRGVGGVESVTNANVTNTARTLWSGRFSATAVLTGTFTEVAPDPKNCGAGVVHPTFTAHRTHS